MGSEDRSSAITRPRGRHDRAKTVPRPFETLWKTFTTFTRSPSTDFSRLGDGGKVRLIEVHFETVRAIRRVCDGVSTRSVILVRLHLGSSRRKPRRLKNSREDSHDSHTVTEPPSWVTI